MIIFSRMMAFCFTLFLLIGCTTTNKSPRTLPWNMSVGADTKDFQLTPDVSKIVVFRLNKTNGISPPVNVFINGDYHASLLAGNRAWIIDVCPGENEINISTNRIGYGQASSVNKDFPAGKLSFYQVDVDNYNNALGHFVTEEQAMSLVSKLNIQDHTITRVAKVRGCPNAMVRFDTSTLFKFSRSDLAGMTNNGKEVISDLAFRINNEYASIEKILVEGHTDPIGDYDYNIRLSERRAQTISSLLNSEGIDSSLITSQGFGPNQLLRTDCAQQYTNFRDLIICNQPNRRVEVKIFGIKK